MWVNVWFNGVHSLVFVYSLSSARVMMEVKALREDNKCHRGMLMVAEMNEWDIFQKKSYLSLIQQAKKGTQNNNNKKKTCLSTSRSLFQNVNRDVMFSYTFWHHVCHITSLTKHMWLSDSTSYYFLPLLIPHTGSLEMPESIPPGHVTNLLQGLTETLRSLWMERRHGWCKSCPQFPNSSHICCCRHTREMIGQSCCADW